jgi:hypothetical protein
MIDHVLHSEDKNWIWACCLYPAGPDRTGIVSRNPIATPEGRWLRRAFGVRAMKTGSLIMERKCCSASRAGPET